MRQIERESRGILRPGQDLVVAGFAGLAGSRRIAAERDAELSRWFSAAYRAKLREEQPAACRPEWILCGASEWEEAGEGGVYTALWTLSGAYGVGFTVDLRKIPVKQGTIEICERYGLNPYRLWSEGCTVLAADNGGRLTERLAAEGVTAAVIGCIREGIAREVTYGDVRGFMERPREDELCRLGIVL